MTKRLSVPTLSARAATELFDHLRDQDLPSDRNDRLERPNSIRPSHIPLEAGFESLTVEEITEKVFALAEGFPSEMTKVEKSRNAFDLALARLLFDALKGFPTSVLRNRDFWRYLAVHELFEIGAWRYPDQGKKTWGQNFGVSGNFSRCFPYKAFLRGKLIAKIISEGLPWSDIEDVDFYDSHLFGRRNALVPGVASALNSVRLGLPSSRALDPYATVIRQYRGTHLTELLNQEELGSILEDYVAKPGKRRFRK